MNPNDETTDELDQEIKQLQTEASERWGERWTIEVSHYADGDYNAYAVQYYGRDRDDHLIQDRIYIADDGMVFVHRLTREQRDIDSERLEGPTQPSQAG
jgi:hypothetical protein